MSLLELIQTSPDKRHTLFTWTTTTFGNISNISQYGQNTLPESALHKLDNVTSQFETFLQYLTTAQEKEQLDSHYIYLRLSHVYCMSLCHLKRSASGKIFDGAELLLKVLGEEYVSLPDAAEGSFKTSKKKKSSSKKNYMYTPAKDLAAVTLGQLFELFPNELTSLIPLVHLYTFKNLKKSMEKPKYRHATFMVSLLKLYKVVISHCEDGAMDPQYITKFTKISKTIFESIYENDESFPVDVVRLIIETWGIHLTHKTYLKDNSSNLLDAVFSKFHDSELGIYGFINDKTRVSTAKILGDILFHYLRVAQIISLKDVYKFYVKFFTSAKIRDVRSACFESIIHFINLNISIDINFLNENGYISFLENIIHIFNEKNIQNLRMGTISRFLRYLKHTHNLLLPYVSDANKIQLLVKILATDTDPVNKNSNELSALLDAKVNNQWHTIALLEFIEKIISDLGSSFINERLLTSTLRMKLLELCVSENFTVRIYATKVIKDFLSKCNYMIYDIMENALDMLTKGFSPQNKFEYSKLHGYAFLLANLVQLANKEIVPYDLIMRVTVFSTKFIKNHTTLTSGDIYFKGLICWILMTGLMNYNDEPYLRMQTPQLFLFWKVLLTHSFTYRSEEELKRNLEMRTHSLTCLLTYLNNIPIDKETAKQISYLLTKCSNFNHSVTLKSKDIDNILLTNENRILQVYIKIQDYICTDFNSSLLLLIMKNFSDPNLYIEHSNNILSSINMSKKNKRKEENKKEPIISLSVDSILRQQGDFAFGLSSRIEKNCIKNMYENKKGRYCVNKFQLNELWINNEYKWYYCFEEEVTRPISTVLSFDSLVLLYKTVPNFHQIEPLPKVTTSLIDFSMELFSNVFPYLNSKIQFSVLETLNLSLFSKATTPLRSVALCANICTVLYQSLLHIHHNQIGLEENVGRLIIDTLKKIEFHNDEFLTVLKSECLGLVYSTVSTTLAPIQKEKHIEGGIKSLVKNLVDIEEPYPRMFFILGLASIYKYNTHYASFNKVYETIRTLINDPHPVIHAWSLYAQFVLIKKHLTLDLSVVEEILISLEQYITNCSYGIYGDSSIRYNYCLEYNSHYIISCMTRLLAEKLGPSFSELSKKGIESFRNITNGSLISNEIRDIMNSLKTFENIAIFKLNSVLSEKPFIETIKTILQFSLLLGIGSNEFNILCTHPIHAIPFSSSYNVITELFELLNQLLKLGKVDEISTEVGDLSWGYITLYPDNQVIKLYFHEWLRCTQDKVLWFDKLYKIINMSTQQIFGSTFQKMQLIYSNNFTYSRALLNMHDNKDNPELSNYIDHINWQLMHLILELYSQLLVNIQDNSISLSISGEFFEQMCKVIYQGTSIQIKSCNLVALNILKSIMEILKRSDYVVINDQQDLVQREIQLSSAIMPIFHKDVSTTVITDSIELISDIICLTRPVLSEDTKTFQFLVKLLTVFDENNQEINIVAAKFITKTSKRKIQIAILSAWANITKESILNNDDRLSTYIKPYLKVLLPLWTISLREYLMTFYKKINFSSENSTENIIDLTESKKSLLKLYEPVWLNYTNVLGALFSTKDEEVLDWIHKDELRSFMFLLIGRCLDELSRCDDNCDMKIELLSTLHNILNSSSLQGIILDNHVFQEFISIFERIVKRSDAHEKKVVVKLLDMFISNYIREKKTVDAFLVDIDKLYDLLRLLLIMIADILPFIELNYCNMSSDIKLSSENVALITQIFAVLEHNIRQFPHMFKLDLYACLLFVIGKILYSEYANVLAYAVFPLLKSIVCGLDEEGTDFSLIDRFYDSVKNVIRDKLSNDNFIAFYLTLLCNKYSNFTEDDINYFGERVLGSIKRTNKSKFAFAGIEKLIQLNFRTKNILYFLDYLFRNIFTNVNNLEPKMVDTSLALLSMLVSSYKKEESDKAVTSLTLLLIFLCKVSRDQIESKTMSEIILLIENNALLFKRSILENLTKSQRNTIENILKDELKLSGSLHDENNITLKNFE